MRYDDNSLFNNVNREEKGGGGYRSEAARANQHSILIGVGGGLGLQYQSAHSIPMGLC